MKFPKDSLSVEQEDDYKYISGLNRFSVLWITEDNDQYNHQNSFAFSPDLAPIFAKQQLPDRYKLESWVVNGKQPINLLSEEQITEDLSSYFRPETLQQLQKDTPWLFQAGEFTASENREYSFIPEGGGEVLRYSESELTEAWQEIRAEADITDDLLDEESTTMTYADDPSVIQLPTIVVTADASTGMSTGDKIILGLEIAATVAMFIPGVNVGAGAVRAGLFLFRLAKAAKLSSKVGKGLQRIFNTGRQVAPAF